jgi:hypothetical protein
VGFCSSPKIVVVYNPLGWTREEYIRFPVRNLVWLSISLHFLLATWRQLSAAFSQNFLYWLQLQKWVPFYTGMLTSACLQVHASTLCQWKFWWAWWRWVTGFKCYIGGHWWGGQFNPISACPSSEVSIPITQVVCRWWWCKCC